MTKKNLNVIYNKCCGTGYGFGRIGIILAYPDPEHPGPADPDSESYPFQPNIKLNYTFSNIVPKILTFTDETDNQCMAGTAVNTSPKNVRFSNICKTL
jgi:hypothetical protein